VSDTPDYFDDVAEGEAIDDFLISLASGLASAQQQLSELTANDALGVGGVTYQIPRLDFELSLQIHTEASSSSGGQSGKSASRKKTRVSPVNSSSSTDLKANSTLKGSFVAVPVNAGRPQSLVSLAFEDTGKTSEVKVIATVADTTGESQAGIEVEINVDRDLSDEVNQREGIEKSLQDDTKISSGVVTTNVHGIAEATLLISSREAKAINIAVTADVQNSSTSLLYRTGS